MISLSLSLSHQGREKVVYPEKESTFFSEKAFIDHREKVRNNCLHRKDFSPHFLSLIHQVLPRPILQTPTEKERSIFFSSSCFASLTFFRPTADSLSSAHCASQPKKASFPLCKAKQPLLLLFHSSYSSPLFPPQSSERASDAARQPARPQQSMPRSTRFFLGAEYSWKKGFFFSFFIFKRTMGGYFQRF